MIREEIISRLQAVVTDRQQKDRGQLELPVAPTLQTAWVQALFFMISSATLRGTGS
jgi:hypothetical protein